MISTNLNPVFNYFEDFFVRNLVESDVCLEMMDYDTTSGDDEIGKVILNLKDVAPKVRQCGLFHFCKSCLKWPNIYFLRFSAFFTSLTVLTCY